MLNRLWKKFHRKRLRPNVLGEISSDILRRGFRLNSYCGLLTIVGFDFPSYASGESSKCRQQWEQVEESFQRMMRIFDLKGQFYAGAVSQFERELESLCLMLDAPDWWDSLRQRCHVMRSAYEIPDEDHKSRQLEYEQELRDYEADPRVRHNRLIERNDTLKRFLNFVDEHAGRTNGEIYDWHKTPWGELKLMCGYLTPFAKLPHDHFPINFECFADDANSTCFYGFLKRDRSIDENCPIARIGERYGTEIVADNFIDFLALGKRAGFDESFKLFDIKYECALSPTAQSLFSVLDKEFELPSFEEAARKIPELKDHYDREVRFAIYQRY